MPQTNEARAIVYRMSDNKYEVTCSGCHWKSAYSWQGLENARAIGRLHVKIKHEPTPQEVKDRWKKGGKR